MGQSPTPQKEKGRERDRESERERARERGPDLVMFSTCGRSESNWEERVFSHAGSSWEEPTGVSGILFKGS